MTIVTVIAILLFLTVWTVGVAWQVGYFRRLSRKLTISGWRIRLSDPDKVRGTIEGFQRRSLIEKSRPLLAIDLLSSFLGVVMIAAVILIAVSLDLSMIYLIAGLAIAFSIFIFGHTRYRFRYLTKLTEQTRCPQCGKVPMLYKAQSSDERCLLICTHCHIEWDIGPAD